MSASDEKLELLIGEFLDGEISPGERRLLDQELQGNSEAQELLEQLRTLRRCSREAVPAAVRSAVPAEDIIGRAWQQSKRSSWRRIIRADGHLRFVAGLAAGLVLGLLLHVVLVWESGPPAGTGGRPPVAAGASGEPVRSTRSPRLTGRDPAQRVTRELDWYVVTDGTGNQWLIEGVREGMVRPAAYHGGL
ncbi:MAG: hypothetical protein JW741_09730 [Sedimentisphaerales bacterium]|nr:hypothetical protein [Sedimentisphaerales bacterium]